MRPLKGKAVRCLGFRVCSLNLCSLAKALIALRRPHIGNLASNPESYWDQGYHFFLKPTTYCQACVDADSETYLYLRGHRHNVETPSTLRSEGFGLRASIQNSIQKR